MKKYLLFLAVCGQCSAGFNDFYAGANVGGERAMANGNTLNSLGLIDVFENTSVVENRASSDGHNHTATGACYAGYGTSCYCLFFGLEGFFNFPRHQIKKENRLESSLDFVNESKSVHIRQTLEHCLEVTSRPVEFGLDFKTGYLLTPYALLYGRVGAAFNRFSLASHSAVHYEDETSGLVTPPELPSTAVAERFCLRKGKGVTGLRLGFGLELQFCQNFGVTLDYIYTDYGDFCVKGEHDTTIRGKTLPGGLKVDANAHVRNNAVLLGLSYRFCLSSLLRWCW